MPQARSLLDEAKAGAQEVGIPIVEARIDELASLFNEPGLEGSLAHARWQAGQRSPSRRLSPDSAP